MKTVAVFGGTGFLGTEVVRRLVLEKPFDDRVVVVSRNPRPDHPCASRVAFRRADVTRPETLPPALEGVDVVVQAVQFPTAPIEVPRKGWTYMRVDGAGTEALAEAARKAGVKRFLYLSGAGAGEERRENWFRAKDRAEAAVRANFPNDYTIFRPSWVYGPGDRSMNKFLAFARYLPFFPVFGDGRNRIQPLYVEDLARAVCAAIETDASRAKTYGLGGPEVLTMREVAEVVFRAVSRRPPLGVVPHPIPLMKAIGFFAELIFPVPPISRGMIDFVTMEALVDNSLAASDLGFRPLPLAKGLARYVPSS